MKKSVFTKDQAQEAKKQFDADRRKGETMRVKVEELEALLLFGSTRGISKT